MKQWKRTVALLLTVILTLSAFPAYASETESSGMPENELSQLTQPEGQENETLLSETEAGQTTEPQEKQTEPGQQGEQTDPVQSEEPPAQQTETPEQQENPTQPQETPEQQPGQPEDVPSESEEPDQPGQTPDEPVPGEEPQKTITDQQVKSTKLVIREKKNVAIYYDDRYSFESLYPGYSILDIDQRKVDSYQVKDGAKSNKKDSSVLESGSNGATDVIACGTGTAVVTLSPKKYLAQAQKLWKQGNVTDKPQELENTETQEISCVQVTVTVKPAKLDLFYLGGQSNMEGMCNGGYRPKDSVMCTPGTVYSSYVPAYQEASKVVNGIGLTNLTDASGKGWKNDVKAYLPSSLTANTTLSGKKLVYSLNALTSEGDGKTGPDSGIGYEWNRLTKHKVWLVNAGWTGSSIVYWIPGEDCYERAKAAYTSAYQVWAAEIAAGHYAKGSVLMFWLQGEADRGMSAEKYLTQFNSMWRGLKDQCKIKRLGIISVRASRYESNFFGTDDIMMTGPRIVQYALASDPARTDIYMVSNVNENWVSDKGVKNYFAKAYPSGTLDYPCRKGANRKLPVTEAGVHPYIHFTQVAHNENGITAAQGMYQTFQQSQTPQSVIWKAANGKNISSLRLLPQKSVVAVPVVEPVYTAKQVGLSYSTSMLSYTAASGMLKAKRDVCTTVTATCSGKKLGMLMVTRCAVPTGIQAVNTASGVKISWKSVNHAEKYRVFYKTGSSGWKILGETTKTTYIAKKARSGIKYTFTVRCVNAGVTAYTSMFDTRGATVTYVAAPVIQKISSGKGTVTLSWNECAGAGGYRVYYKIGNGSWKNAGKTKKTSFTLNGLAKGKYTFTVRCMNSTATAYTSGYDPQGKSVAVR